MLASLRHRGPDDEGVHISSDGRLGLATRRLAVVDISPAGHMPMGSNGLWITYNGEVYNAASLREELAAAGHRFASTSDTEVVLRGYEAWGESVVHRLRGMFAFAIWDDRAIGPARKIFLARDRLGIKPLYYTLSGNTFAFASELRALRASGFVDGTLSPAGLVGYLMFGAVPSPWTVWDGARALEPGSTLTVSSDAGHVLPVAQRFWSMPGSHRRVQHGDAVEEVRALLLDAVKCHLVSDVPLGAFLSGGVDSSTIVSLARRNTVSLRTCAIVFDDARYDEGSYARAVAAATGAEHYERIVTVGEVLRERDRMIEAMDQPTIDGVNTYFVSKAAREAGLTVALSGLGGDELFGGYAQTFRGVPRLATLSAVAARLPGALALVRAGVRTFGRHQRWRKVEDMLGRSPGPAAAYVACRGLFADNEVRQLVGEDTWGSARTSFSPASRLADQLSSGSGQEGNGLFSWVSRAELSTYTRDQLLRDTDVMSMAHSLEVRVPFLDHLLVERLLTLPDDVKWAGGRSKGLLLDAVGDALPPIVRKRREKRGFVFPFEAWLRGPLRPASDEWSARCAGVLQANGLAAVAGAFAAGRLHWSRVWAVEVLSRWLDQCAH